MLLSLLDDSVPCCPSLASRTLFVFNPDYRLQLNSDSPLLQGMQTGNPDFYLPTLPLFLVLIRHFNSILMRYL